MIHTLFDKHRLEGAPNFRDLGGLPAADGRRVQSGRLLRCGHLGHITPSDADKLLHDYHLKTVIDMRTENEISRRPDTVLDGVEYLRCPILKRKQRVSPAKPLCPTIPWIPLCAWHITWRAITPISA